jgi:hypothetical protein
MKKRKEIKEENNKKENLQYHVGDIPQQKNECMNHTHRCCEKNPP